MKLSIAIPIFNEAKYLESYLSDLISQLKKSKLGYEIILSENGSRDQTLKIARKISKEEHKVNVITTPVANYGNAVKRAFLVAKGDYLVLFDLDYYDVNFLLKSVPLLTTFDAVVGAKKGANSKDHRSPMRRLVTRGFTLLLKMFFNMKISDTHGIKILNRKRFLPLIKKCRFTKEIFDTELLIRGEYEHLKIGEIGVVVKERRSSRTSIIKRSIRTILDLFKLKIILLKEYGAL